MRRSLQCSLFIALVALALIAQPIQAQDQGKMVADSGFRPEKNGFSFENYTTESNPEASNLTPADMVAIFGKDVCATTTGDCILTPAAQEWMDATNADIGGGHCDGMATLSSMFYYKQVDVTKYGAATAYALTFDGNTALQREIAEMAATGGTSPAQDATTANKTPAQIVDMLIEAFKDGANAKDGYVIGIYKPEYKDGHAVTPYAISDQGDGIYWIMIYDNNNPGEARHIVVDKNANTWSYNAATTPAEPEDLYEGDATTFTLDLTPNSARLKQQECTFCESPESKSGIFMVDTKVQYNQISLSGRGDLLITDGAGHKLGYSGGKFYNEIPGAKVSFGRTVKGRDDDPEPVYFVPTGIAFTIVLDGSTLKAENENSVWMIGPGYVVSVEDIALDSTQKDTLAFSPDGKKLTYTTTSSEKPLITVGFEGKDADYDIEVANLSTDGGGSVEFNLDREAGTLSFGVKGAKSSALYDLTVARIDDSSEQVFTHNDVELASGAVSTLNYLKWDGKGKTIGVDVTNPDGTKGASVDLENQSTK